jgi:membrane protein YqaA with SNARE-associated domain
MLWRIKVRKNKIFLSIFLVFVLILFILVYAFSSSIEIFVQEKLSFYGYPLVFIFSFLSDLLMQPFGPEIPGSFAVLTGFDFWLIILFVLLGSYCASFLGFYFGREILFEKVQGACTTSKYFNYCRFFNKYGKLALFISSVSPLPWVFFVWLSGSFRMRIRDFVLFGIVPRSIRIFLLLYLFSFL